MDLYQTTGNSPPLPPRHLFDTFGYTSVRLDHEPEPQQLADLPRRFVVVHRGGATWLQNTAARRDGGAA